MNRLRVLRAAVVFRAVVLALFAAGSAAVAVTPRIAGQIDGTARVELSGTSTPLPANMVDLGPVPDRQPLPLLTLHFTQTPAQQADLAGLLAAQQNPASSQYHHWLTPEEFGKRFGPSPSDLVTVSNWLAAEGFHVSAVARGGQFIQFSGTAAQARSSFGAAIHRVLLNGQTHLANLRNVSLPASLAGLVSGVAGLDDLHPGAHVTLRSVTGTSSIARSDAEVTPLYTLSAAHYLAPGDFYTIYDEQPLLMSSINGAGVSVAVVGQTDIHASDIAAFQAAAGLALNPAAVTLYGSDPGFSNAADLLVAEQAIEWVSAIAPGATLLYANSIDALYGSLTLAIDNDLAPIIADGYGQCEAALQANNLVYYDQILEQAAAEGVTITAPSGEYGATDCDTAGASATAGLAVDFPASSPLVTGVGGTAFNEGSGSYWSAANGSGGSSAISYIPELVWNDDSYAGLAASGGGASLYFAKPAWQSGSGVPADSARDVPDVALAGSAAHDSYLVCVSGSCASGFADGSGGVNTAGGTSSASAAFAGLLALVEQKAGGRLGVANPTLYALAGSSYAGAVFHDVTAGTNASPCTAGSTGCAGGGSIGYSATRGYDQATGLGSVDAYHLVNDWSLVTTIAGTDGPALTYTNVAGNATNITAGIAVTLTVSVASAVSTETATPSGTVQITVDGVAAGSPVGLSGGSAMTTLNTASLSVGTHLIQATYLGDVHYQGSRGAFELTVSASAGPDFSLTPTSSTVTASSGYVAPGVSLTVTALNGFTGNVTFAAGTTTSTNVAYAFSINPVTLTASVPSGSSTLTLFAYTIAKNKPSGLRNTPGWVRGGSGVVLAGLILLVVPRRRSRFVLTLIVSGALTVGVAGLGSCASNHSATASSTNIPATTPTPAGTYIVTVQASGSVNGAEVSHSSTITFVVQ